MKIYHPPLLKATAGKRITSRITHHVSMSKIIVETQHLQLELPPDGLKLSDNEVLKEIAVAYETYGKLSTNKDNAIYVCQALTGDAHAAFYHEGDDDPGWWDELIGPGKGIDTDLYYVVCANILGGCKGTTGPSSINPDTGKPYGTGFPHVSVRDVVAVQKLLLDQLGVPELYAVIGGSLGGMQALEWAVRFPDYVKRCICVASAANLSPQAVAFDVIARGEIESDPHWNDGAYYDTDEDQQPGAGLARARQIGHVTYLSSASMEIKFGRDERESPYPGQSSPFSTNFQVESYLYHQGSKFVKRFDANSYLYISRMMDMFDLAAEFGSVQEAMKQTKSRFLIVSISSDWLFPPAQQLEMVEGLIASRKDVSYFQIESPYGHDAFLLEYEALSLGVDAFLNGEATTEAVEGRLDLDLISEMLEPETHVLDIGSGGGEMMVALQRRRRITGVCVDVGFDKVVECMRKGLPALHLDADEGLSRIATDSFDCVLLNQTIQQLNSALAAIKQILRIAPCGIVGFPNIAYYSHRLSLIAGNLPVSKSLPFEWYDTPNIHLITVREFESLCRKNNLVLEEVRYLAETVTGRFLIAFGLVNLGSERALVKLKRV